jgi:hypothetical protein
MKTKRRALAAMNAIVSSAKKKTATLADAVRARLRRWCCQTTVRVMKSLMMLVSLVIAASCVTPAKRMDLGATEKAIMLGGLSPDEIFTVVASRNLMVITNTFPKPHDDVSELKFPSPEHGVVNIAFPSMSFPQRPH